MDVADRTAGSAWLLLLTDLQPLPVSMEEAWRCIGTGSGSR